MNTSKKILLSLSLLFITSLGAKVAQAQSVTLGVDFGTVPSGGSECTGYGVCDCTVVGSGGTKVNFSISADGNTLIMQFSLADLQNNQPDQVSYMETGYYVLGAPYALNSSLFSELGLPSNAQINANSNGTVTIDGDQVTMYQTIISGS